MIALFTIFELEQLSDNQLNHLHHILSRLLIATEPTSPDQRNILATLENIEIVLVLFFFHRLHLASIFPGSNAGARRYNMPSIFRSHCVLGIRFQMR